MRTCALPLALPPSLQVKNVEMLFSIVRENIPEDQLVSVNRKRAVKSNPDAAKIEKKTGELAHTKVQKIPALSTKQLKEHLEEFKDNVFIERLVRVFSESGEQVECPAPPKFAAPRRLDFKATSALTTTREGGGCGMEGAKNARAKLNLPPIRALQHYCS